MATMQEKVEALPTMRITKPIDRDTFYDAYNEYVDGIGTMKDIAKKCGVSVDLTTPLVYAVGFGLPLPKKLFKDEWTDEDYKKLKEERQGYMKHAHEVQLERLAKEKAKNGK